MKKKKALTLLLACTLALAACTVDQVLSSINVLIQAAGSIGAAIGAVSPADAAIVSGLSALASKGLSIIQADYDAYKKSGATTDLQKLEAAITAVQTNLPAELAAAHVYSPAAQAKCTAWVNLTVTSLDIVAEALPQIESASTAGERQAAEEKVSHNPALVPQALQARWAKEVCRGDARCSSLVKVHEHGALARYGSLGWLK